MTVASMAVMVPVRVPMVMTVAMGTRAGAMRRVGGQ